jgi:molecular chaperone HscA
MDALMDVCLAAKASEDAKFVEAATLALAKGTEQFAAQRMNRGIAKALSGKTVDQV